MDKLTEIPGPVLTNGKTTFAQVILRANKATSSVFWSAGTIEGSAVASDAFVERCEIAGLRSLVIDWWNRNEGTFGMRARLEAACRSGHARIVPTVAAAELLLIVKEIYRAAASDLPLLSKNCSREKNAAHMANALGRPNPLPHPSPI